MQTFIGNFNEGLMLHSLYLVGCVEFIQQMWAPVITRNRRTGLRPSSVETYHREPMENIVLGERNKNEILL